jgi:hypothetical protein
VNVNRLLLLSSLLCPLFAAQEPPAPARLRIVVLEGEGAINNISEHRAKEPVAQVLDDNSMPVRGASVTFLLPETGPSGEFGGGVRVLTTFVDEKGQAVGRGLVPNQSAGPFQIRAVASFEGLTASAVINQTNAPRTSPSTGGISRKFWLIAVAGGAAATGVALAARGHGGSSQTSPAVGPSTLPGIVISPGAPTFQPPH